MKRFMIILLVTTVCSNAIAGISDEFDSVYDDLLQFLSFREDGSSSLVNADLGNDPAGSDIDSYLPDAVIPSAGQSDPGLLDPEAPTTSVITNPEPCSIILSSIGLGIAGYLKRRRAI